jgi:hypothetical protein
VTIGWLDRGRGYFEGFVLIPLIPSEAQVAHSRSPKFQLWNERLLNQARSNLSVAEFCRRNGLQTVTFYYWRKKIIGNDSGQGNGLGQAHDRTLIPVRVAPKPVLAEQFVIRFPSGVTIEAPGNALLPAIEKLAAIQTESGRHA